MNDAQWMLQALDLARQSAAEGEVPVGAVVTLGDRLVGQGRNRRERGKNALYHAELVAIDQACKALGGWRLWQCCLYVTLEPCPMCAGAILNAQLPRVVYGTKDAKNGAASSVVSLLNMPFSHRPEVVSGVLETECSQVLRDFFLQLRKTRAAQPPRWKK